MSPAGSPAAAARRPGWTRLRPGRTAPTRRGSLQALLAVVLYTAGANAGAGWVTVLATLLAGAVLAAWWTTHRAARRVEVRRTLPAQAVAGTPVEVSVQVRAPGGGHLVVADALGGAGAGPPGARLVGTLRPARGSVRGAEVRVELADPLGLARASAAGWAPSPLLAVPAVPRAPGSLPRRVAETALDLPAVRARAGVEYAGLRAYAPGDPPRTVHWRATARHGRMVVGEPARPAAPALRIALAGGSWSQAALDRAVERVCALAAAGAAAGRPTEVAVDGAVQPWSEAARRDLALLPPHAGARPRPLAPPPPGAVETVTVGRDEVGTEAP